MTCGVKGLVAFITGAAAGLGRGTLLRFLKNGAAGVCSYDMQAFKANDEEKSAYGIGEDRLMVIQGDVRDETKVADAFAECHKQFGRIDAIINCAGVTTAFFTFNPSNRNVFRFADYRDVVDINVNGTFNVIRLGVGFLAKNEPSEGDKVRGHIITTSGIQSFDGQMGQTSYASSAGAIESLVSPVAKDFSLMGIRCVNICVGYHDTPVFSRANADFRDFFRNSSVFPRRMGQPEDYAQLVESVITNPYINATSITLDGCMRPHIFPYTRF
ncbi:3-hydroxyacyl-CoA dehydrogenase type-2-like [Brevipalpus obovatus]|uniref:3-hydroxyacyl-CoA dehydrogenase type-2-like n=1 Tax=Brevipalpus obovatus TaxID=246614 RepID=UPI003D9F9CB2